MSIAELIEFLTVNQSRFVSDLSRAEVSSEIHSLLATISNELGNTYEKVLKDDVWGCGELRFIDGQDSDKEKVLRALFLEAAKQIWGE